jgi:iron complex transport system substrate-binding protein
MSGGNGFVNILTFTSPPRRVVSLVPSMTESLFELGLGAALVGVTDYCRPPGDAGRRLPRVGGTRDPDIEAVGQLNPDLVLANQEENRREAVQALEALGLKVWVTFPRSVQQAMDVLWAVLRLFGVPGENPKIRTLEMTLEWTQRAAQARQGVRVFCPIWHGRSGDGEPWWMTFAEETYAHDVLASCGGENVFADRRRRYPLEADLGSALEEPAGERDTRYPCVGVEEVVARQPELVLLPDEPGAFSDEDEACLIDALGGTPAVRGGHVHRLDGRLLFWHGTHLARALVELPALLQIEA